MRRITHRGMTLVELLVVITIIGILGGIVALVAPRFQEQSRVAEGSRQFTNWLNLARLRAQRDKAPRGIRLSTETLPAPTLAGGYSEQFYYKFSYIEQPEDITGQPSEIIPVPQSPQQNVQINTQRKAFQAAVGAQLPPALKAVIDNPGPTATGWRYLLWLQGRNLVGVVQQGDVVEFGGSRYRLIHDPVPYPAVANATDSVLVLHRRRDEVREDANLVRTSPLPPYRITRAARPIAGEPELTLPANVALDFLYPPNSKGASRTWPVPTSGGTGYFEVIFSPSGEVMGAAGAGGRIIFWMRDVTLTDPGPGQMPPGENRLVVLHCRNGQVTSHPVNPTLDSNGLLTDPYSFVRDGKSSAAENE